MSRLLIHFGGREGKSSSHSMHSARSRIGGGIGPFPGESSGSDVGGKPHVCHSIRGAAGSAICIQKTEAVPRSAFGQRVQQQSELGRASFSEKVPNTGKKEKCFPSGPGKEQKIKFFKWRRDFVEACAGRRADRGFCCQHQCPHLNGTAEDFTKQ